MIQMLELTNEYCKEVIMTMFHEVRENTLKMNEKSQQNNARHKEDQNTIMEFRY